MQWAQEQSFFHPVHNEDDDTNRERERHIDRLMFAVSEIAEKAAELNEAFDATFDEAARRAK